MTTQAKWAARVKAWRESGQTADAYAAGKPFTAGTLRFWLSRLRRGERTVVTMARVVRRGDGGVENGRVEVEVGGARISVARGFDAALLREVVAALGGTR